MFVGGLPRLHSEHSHFCQPFQISSTAWPHVLGGEHAPHPGIRGHARGMQPHGGGTATAGEGSVAQQHPVRTHLGVKVPRSL